MKSMVVTAFIIAMLVGVWSQANAAYPCRIMMNSLPPFNIVDGEDVSGISVDLLKAMYNIAGLDISDCEIRPTPFARAYREIQTRSNQIVTSMARTPQREPLFRWVGPIYTIKMSVIGRADSPKIYNSLDELNHAMIGTVRNTAPEQLLLKQGLPESRIESAANVEINVEKLDRRRLEYVAHVFSSLSWAMRQQDIDPTNYVPRFELASADLYYALSPDTSDDIVDRLQAALDKIKQDPSVPVPYETILARYGTPMSEPIASARP